MDFKKSTTVFSSSGLAGGTLGTEVVLGLDSGCKTGGWGDGQRWLGDDGTIVARGRLQSSVRKG